MPSKVEEVRLSIERVRLGVGGASDLCVDRNSEFVASAGEGGYDESLEAGVISNPRRGIGR